MSKKKWIIRGLALDFSDAPQQRRKMRGCVGCYYRGSMLYAFAYPVCDYIAVTDHRRGVPVHECGGCDKYLTQEDGRELYGMAKKIVLMRKGI